MRLNSDFVMNVVAGESMLINLGEGASLDKVYSLSEPLAWLWKRAEGEDFEEEDLVRWLREEYEVDEERATKEVHAIVLKWKDNGMVR